MNPVFYFFIIPLFSAAVIHFTSKNETNTFAALFSILANVGCLVLALILLNTPLKEVSMLWTNTGLLEIHLGFLFDSLAKTMLVITTSLALLIHIGFLYASTKQSYFSNLSLVLCAISGVVLSDNFLMLFIFLKFLEVTCYFFLTNKPNKIHRLSPSNYSMYWIGDAAILSGIFILWGIFNTLTFSKISVVEPTAFLPIAVSLLFCGSLLKSIPFLLQINLAQKNSKSYFALLYSPLLLTAIVYTIIRSFTTIGIEHVPSTLHLLGLGCFTILLAVLIVILQKRIQRILDLFAAIIHFLDDFFISGMLMIGLARVFQGCIHFPYKWMRSITTKPTSKSS